MWDGDEVLYEVRARGKDNAGWYELEADEATAGGADNYPLGRAGYTHASGLDQPVTIVRQGMEGVGTVAVAPHVNWQGDYEIGTRMDGQSTATCSQGTAGCPPITWPGSRLTADGENGSGQALTSWFGNLIANKADQSGLQYMRNRYYDPKTGRFTQEDPIGLAGGLNLYGFANGDPVNFSDPFGLCPWCIPIAIGLFELGSTLYDSYQAAKTVTDAKATRGDKAWAVSGAVAGLGLPGPGTLYSKGAAKLTKWGYEGAAKHRAVLSKLQEAGTHVDLHGVVPTRQEAERLIHQARGRIERIQRAHRDRGHPYAHINYITATGEKATLRVESVGREFIRNPR